MMNESNQGQRAGAQFDDEIDLRELLGVLLSLLTFRSPLSFHPGSWPFRR